jgi:NAD(P)-dependent dehydrogenase (short-subunit alcohol dehydrogenase family)
MSRRVMVVTGGSRGIGASVARLAAIAGYDVAVNFVRNADAADAVVKAVEEAGGRGAAFRADVGDDSQVKRMFSEIDAKLGRVHVLVNNAGILGSRRVEDMDEESLQEIFRANVFSMYYCSREAVRRMSTKHGGKGGVIVNMSSVASRLGGLAGGSHYAATKGAIDSFSLALAKEVGGEGIRVNTIRPGLIETEIHDVHGGMNEQLAKSVPLGRSGTADEVARTVLWLASDDASYVHAAVVDVAGGR